jgi:hypothetical protein
MNEPAEIENATHNTSAKQTWILRRRPHNKELCNIYMLKKIITKEIF